MEVSIVIVLVIIAILLIVVIRLLHLVASAIAKYHGFFIKSQAEQDADNYRLCKRVYNLEKRLDSMEGRGD